MLSETPNLGMRERSESPVDCFKLCQQAKASSEGDEMAGGMCMDQLRPLRGRSRGDTLPRCPPGQTGQRQQTRPSAHQIDDGEISSLLHMKMM